MDIDNITSDIEITIRGELPDEQGNPAETFLLSDLGEIYIRYGNRQHFKVTIEPIPADDLTFIDEEDWAV